MKTSTPRGNADLHPLTCASWRKSSRSQGAGAECVELVQTSAHSWRKSSHSTGQGGDCVEMAALLPAIAIRDSKDPAGPHLIVSPATAWALIDAIKQGRHDL
ncbi:DUF397 domain-containing protein [Spirillospora sp. NPDC048832]